MNTGRPSCLYQADGLETTPQRLLLIERPAHGTPGEGDVGHTPEDTQACPESCMWHHSTENDSISSETPIQIVHPIFALGPPFP